MQYLMQHIVDSKTTTMEHTQIFHAFNFLICCLWMASEIKYCLACFIKHEKIKKIKKKACN